jgi:hypothetical protein
MNPNYLLLLFGVSIVVWTIWSLVRDLRDSLGSQLESLKGEVQRLAVRIDELSEAIAFSQLPEWRKELTRFQKLPELTLERVRALKPGSIVPLVIREWAVPLDRP